VLIIDVLLLLICGGEDVR